MSGADTKTTTRPTPGLERGIKIACKRISKRALALMEKALDDDSLDMKVRIDVAKEIMNRAWGKPKAVQQVDLNVNNEDFMAALLGARKRAQDEDKETITH